MVVYMDEQLPQPGHGPDAWTLIRDIAVLQVKLVVDGLRDVALVPASLIAGLVSLLSGSDGKPGPQFYRLLALGKQSERWINLFGAVHNSPESQSAPGRLAGGDIDEIVGHVEKFLVEEYRRGGVTAQAKGRIDKALEALHARSARRRN